MPSIQDRLDDREIGLDRVGVTDLVYPVALPERGGGFQTTEATIGLFVELGHETRGAHMSRFVETLERHPRELTAAGIESLLSELRTALGTATAHAQIECTFFVEKRAPVSGARSLMACPLSYEAALGESFDLTLAVEIPVMTVCPCSKEATGGPAHSQRGHVSVELCAHGRVCVEEVAELVEDCASAPVFPLLKGDDERSLIGDAYDRPVFVEDLVRNVAERLDSDVRVYWYRVQAENLDSVHDHNLYACAERSR
jgi:GTP cyclohydrolase I